MCVCLLCLNGCFSLVLVYRFHSCQYSFVLLNLFLDLCVYVCICTSIGVFFYLLLCMTSARLEPHSILNASYLLSYIAACCTCPCYLWSTRFSTSYFCVHERQCFMWNPYRELAVSSSEDTRCRAELLTRRRESERACMFLWGRGGLTGRCEKSLVACQRLTAEQAGVNPAAASPEQTRWSGKGWAQQRLLFPDDCIVRLSSWHKPNLIFGKGHLLFTVITKNFLYFSLFKQRKSNFFLRPGLTLVWE